MMDITAVGEVLIDLTQNGVNEQGIPQFAANPGGAPANLAVAAARLGAKTAFVARWAGTASGISSASACRTTMWTSPPCV